MQLYMDGEGDEQFPEVFDLRWSKRRKLNFVFSEVSKILVSTYKEAQ